MDGKQFPIESESQRIGQFVVTAFDACHPIDQWRPIPLAGDNDYGKDYWIEISDNGQMSYSFFLQLSWKTKWRQN